MAFSASNLSSESRAWSIGPVKVQLMTFSAGAADTSGTITADGLSSINTVILSSLVQTAQPSISGNVATIAFVAPGASVVGQIIVVGK